MSAKLAIASVAGPPPTRAREQMEPSGLPRSVSAKSVEMMPIVFIERLAGTCFIWVTMLPAVRLSTPPRDLGDEVVLS